MEFQELGNLGGLDGEVSGEIRILLMDGEAEDEGGSTLDDYEPVWTTLVTELLVPSEARFPLGSW